MKQRFYDRREAPVYLLEQRGLRVTYNTLQKLACLGGGPEYQIFGNRAVYTEENLDRWAEAKLSRPRRSTSENEEVANVPS